MEPEFSNRGIDLCRSCREPVKWVTTVGGKHMPVDVDPDPAGNIVPIHTEDGIRALVITGSMPEPPEGKPRFFSHFRTCPMADQHRLRPGSPPPEARTCRVCGGVLHAQLVTKYRGVWLHPLCASDLEWDAIEAAVGVVSA